MKILLITVGAAVIIGGAIAFWPQTPATNSSRKNQNTDERSYSIMQVSEHNSKNSCWTIINGRIYDITGYIEQHPGGDKILAACGKDATQIFNSVPAHQDKRPDNIIAEFAIGNLKQ